MKTFRVTWVIDIDAETPREAAQLALVIQRDADSIATSFTVSEPVDGVAIERDIDLSDEVPLKVSYMHRAYVGQDDRRPDRVCVYGRSPENLNDLRRTLESPDIVELVIFGAAASFGWRLFIERELELVPLYAATDEGDAPKCERQALQRVHQVRP